MHQFRAIIGLLFLLHPSVAFARSCADGVQLGTKATVELSGVLHRQVRWGPPNFGESPATDSKFTVWVVSLSKPVRISGAARSGAIFRSPIPGIQFSVDPTTFDWKVLEALDGKMVVATGMLWSATSQGDVMPVVMAIKTLAATSKPVCRIVEN
jgi:hypothetical protein